MALPTRAPRPRTRAPRERFTGAAPLGSAATRDGGARARRTPLYKNFRHVKALEAALQVPPATIHSVVTFVGGSRFKTTMPANVTQGAGFVAYITSFRQPVFTAGEVDELLRRMASARLAPGFATHREHVQNLGSRTDPNAERRCPRCGSPMVLRTVKAGARAGERFWGCSTFPKCRAIQSLA